MQQQYVLFLSHSVGDLLSLLIIKLPFFRCKCKTHTNILVYSFIVLLTERIKVMRNNFTTKPIRNIYPAIRTGKRGCNARSMTPVRTGR